MSIPSTPRTVLKSLVFIVLTSVGAAAQTTEPLDNPGRLLASNCFQCHGTNGTPATGGFDKIAGMSATKVASELSEMRAETIAGSEHPIMTVHAQAYSLAEIDLISRYLATVGATSTGAFKLTVAKTGTGKGTVTSTPSGITCGSTCQKTYKVPTSVTLTATASKGSTFTGWSGACTGTAATCTLSIASATNVGANFASATSSSTNSPSIGLKVEKSGKTYGSIASNPAGADCPLGCEKVTTSLPKNTIVTLTATPTSGRRFVGWSGACRGTVPVCTLTLSSSREVKATFK